MKTRKFEIIFDNAGGALLMTRRFCHFYDDGKRLAQDVREILNGADVSARNTSSISFPRRRSKWRSRATWWMESSRRS